MILYPLPPEGYEFKNGLYVPEQKDTWQVTIVRGAFQQLFTPGIAAAIHASLQQGYSGIAFSDAEILCDQIDREDFMALIQPDTSQIPIWRRPTTKSEHPLTAWRAWGLEVRTTDDFIGAEHRMINEWYLKSVAADCTWEGPVLRAHKRPCDPKYWDHLPKFEQDRTPSGERVTEMYDTMELSGIWTVHTLDQARAVARDYYVPIFGEVQIWGRIAKFKLGYRAEACMIRKLFLLKKTFFDAPRIEGMSFTKAVRAGALKEASSSLSRRYECEVEIV